jgi:hypothetical protein
MLTKQLELTHEQTSPLFRIMWVHNVDEPNRRHYDNNICAFHIGNGLILSVAHNLKSEAQIFKSIDDSIYTNDILPHLNPVQIQLFNQCYPLDTLTNKRYINIVNQNDVQTIVDLLKQINFDTRWLTFTKRNICKPHLIVQFKNSQFYNDSTLTEYFNAGTYFPEPALNRHTFLIEVELVEAFYNEDIALYRIINTHRNVIHRLPWIEVDFSILGDNQNNYYCLQSSPNSEVGKLLNRAHIEGYLEHFGIFPDRIGGNYTFEGTRYLIKGYFRFGSSGAPYVFFDYENDKFKVNAIQSEACPVQLSIENKRDGNFQYVNAIASPLNIVQDKLEPHLKSQAK